jgi:hypothetical protein
VHPSITSEHDLRLRPRRADDRDAGEQSSLESFGDVDAVLVAKGARARRPLLQMGTPRATIIARA